jgi:hypothetical protein
MKNKIRKLFSSRWKKKTIKAGKKIEKKTRKNIYFIKLLSYDTRFFITFNQNHYKSSRSDTN